MVVQFFVNASDELCWDAYPIEPLVDHIGFAVHNWMQMHPRGKVHFVDEKDASPCSKILRIEDDAVYDGEALLGEILDGRFVPSRLLLERPAQVHQAVERFVHRERPDLVQDRQ